MAAYKIKHIKSGLYYRPGKNNLTKNGKIYETRKSPFYDSYDYISVTLQLSSMWYKHIYPTITWNIPTRAYRYLFACVPKTEFEIEYI